MRIEAYTHVQKIYNTGKTSKSEKSTNAGLADKLQISSLGMDYQAARAMVADVSDIREDVTAPIKAKIQAGTYHVSNESFADKLVTKYKESQEKR